MEVASVPGHQVDAAERIDLLWTSGWDSTFRLLSALYLETVTVQPHYVADRERRSTTIELATMEKIRAAIADARPGMEQRILPLALAERAEIPPDAVTTARFDRLAATAHLGTQYEWLARYAADAGLDELELSVHDDDRAKPFLDGKVEKTRDEPLASYRLTAGATGTDLEMFSRFVFPIFDLTKVEMREIAREHGFLDILELAWFCHKPLPGGVPCGICGPCRDATKEGLGDRLPFTSRARQAVHSVVPWTKVTEKVRDLLRQTSAS